MAQIIFVSHANDPIRKAVLWQVYRQLAPQAANPHSFWSGGKRIMCNAPQQIAFTKQNHPVTFKALLSILGRQVGVLCCTPQLSTILNGIDLLAREGAELIICGIDDMPPYSEPFWRGGLQGIGHEYVETIYLRDRIPNNAPIDIDPNALRDGVLFYDVVQDIVNRIMQLINQIH